MSVLIKGMKMPRDCPVCPMSHWNALGQFTGCEIVGGKRYAMTDTEYAKSSTRPDWCPLIDVPTPHGRLIDADELWYELSKAKSYGELNAKRAIRNVEQSETVIEAEE